ncbi:MAG: hypothetical protein B9S32_02030 [Verrucomicrobia bacterium Tous-C9LFEB]|nr:MAG: hypothetical protein B9S32_02030 [Verrucomicrobia bacterium Tous-C9LFEB]
MKTKTHSSVQDSLFFVIDQAVHLLREVPANVLALYFTGSVPFVLAALYFWSEMSRSPFALEYASGASLALAILFIWMKFWHALFSVRLREFIAQESPQAWTVKRLWNLLIVQAALQPSRLIVLPVALLVMIPFGWVYAFYENISVIGNGQSPRLAPVIQRSWNLALLWPKPNHVLIWLLSPFMLVSTVVFAMSMSYVLPLISPHVTTAPDQILFGMALIFLVLILPLSPLGMILLTNIILTLFALPYLLRALFGVETLFTISGLHLFNTTFIVTACALTFLCLDPLLKAAYALRCFYGDSLTSGDDLRLSLQAIQKESR